MNDFAADHAFAQMTHPGHLRTSNEDCSGGSVGHGAFVVCDGMGGAAAGEVASHLAVAVFLESIASGSGELSPEQRLAGSITAANRAVYRRSRASTRLRGMGTTLVTALFDQSTRMLWVAHVGDSRSYLLRARQLRLLTVDHSMVEEQVRAGVLTRAEANLSPVRHVITRALGSQADVEAEIQAIEACPGDLVLLASDGLNRELTDEEICRVLDGVPPRADECTLQAACQSLVEAANARGGRDNVTVLLVRLG